MPTRFDLEAIDCLEGMARLPEASVDVVVTSPPYNLGIAYGAFKDNQARDEYLAWSRRWADAVRRVLKDDGSFFLNVGAAPSNPLLPHQLALEMAKVFVLQNTFHWIKSITVETRQSELVSAGHFKPINSRRYVTDCHEFVFHLTKTGRTNLERLNLGVPYADKSNVRRWAHTKGSDKRCRGNNWFVSYKTIKSRSKDRPHPATFPVALAVNCIRLHGRESELVVLDPFVGIGHSALAAKQCGVKRLVGFDIDAEYIAVARAVVEKGIIEPTVALRRKAGRKGRSREELLFSLEEL